MKVEKWCSSNFNLEMKKKWVKERLNDKGGKRPKRQRIRWI